MLLASPGVVASLPGFTGDPTVAGTAGGPTGRGERGARRTTGGCLPERRPRAAGARPGWRVPRLGSVAGRRRTRRAPGRRRPRHPQGERLTDLETWVGPHGVLHVKGSLYDTDRFTGTPFAGLVLKPLTRAAEQALGWGWTFGTLLLVVALGLVAARALPQPVSRRTSLLAAPVAISLLMLSLPVRNTLHLGQTSIIPVLLVLLGCFAVRGETRRRPAHRPRRRPSSPTVLLFAPLLWFTGRRRAAALSAGVTFAGVHRRSPGPRCRSDSCTYWVHHLAGAGLGGAPTASPTSPCTARCCASA